MLALRDTKCYSPFWVSILLCDSGISEFPDIPSAAERTTSVNQTGPQHSQMTVVVPLRAGLDQHGPLANLFGIGLQKS